MKTVLKSLSVSFILLIICGLAYPLAITGISNVFFKDKANGSMIELNGKKIGSRLLGQTLDDKRFFQGRVADGDQNLGPSNEKLIERVKEDIESFKAENPGIKIEDIPADLMTHSASGLDPHISPKSAKIQIARVSKYTDISEAKLETLVKNCTEKKQLGIFGEERVNVLKLNIEVFKLAQK